MKIEYVPQSDEDPQETQVVDIKFTAGVPVELPPAREWLGHKLADNPWFKVVEDEPVASPPVEEAEPPKPVDLSAPMGGVGSPTEFVPNPKLH